MIGAAVTSDRGGKEGQHGSRPRLSLTYCPWFKEFCAYDGGHDDVRRHETRTRDERAHRGQCEQRQGLARTRRQEISEKTPQSSAQIGILVDEPKYYIPTILWAALQRAADTLGSSGATLCTFSYFVHLVTCEIQLLL